MLAMPFRRDHHHPESVDSCRNPSEIAQTAYLVTQYPQMGADSHAPSPYLPPAAPVFATQPDYL